MIIHIYTSENRFFGTQYPFVFVWAGREYEMDILYSHKMVLYVRIKISDVQIYIFVKYVCKPGRIIFHMFCMLFCSPHPQNSCSWPETCLTMAGNRSGRRQGPFWSLIFTFKEIYENKN